MKFTQEDIESTIDEITTSLRCKRVEHIKDSNFNIITDFWTESDFSKCRELGLDVKGVSSEFLRKHHLFPDVQIWGILVEVEYIGRHRIVMG